MIYLSMEILKQFVYHNIFIKILWFKLKNLLNKYLKGDKVNDNKELKNSLQSVYGEKTFKNVMNNLDEKEFIEFS